MTRSINTLLLALALAACARATQPALEAPAAREPMTPRTHLLAILDSEFTNDQTAAFAGFAQRNGAETNGLLRDLALDPAVPALARANAVLRMGEARMRAFDVYARTIEDPDPRVRGATLGAVGPLAQGAMDAARPIFARGLRDAEVGVQAKAIQELRDQDLELLRDFVAQTTDAELRDVALQTLRNAEAWGAPLLPEADGTLRRIAPTGLELILRPVRRMPEAALAEGVLAVRAPDGAERVIADTVETVGGVIPAVADPMGRFLAVETARRIEVHDLESGAIRIVGPGSAPRPLPFSPDFFYFREIARRDQRGTTALLYEMVRASFQGGAPVVFDSVMVTAQPGRRADMSPIRWARVRDRGTAFVVETDGLANHALPSP
ncbi:MAG TPA: hypothetical protein VF039_01315, partial [Longimicrobiales bacterium]